MYWYWIRLYQDRSKWLALVGAVTNLQVHKILAVPWMTEEMQTSKNWPWCMELFIYLFTELHFILHKVRCPYNTHCGNYSVSARCHVMSVDPKIRWHLKTKTNVGPHCIIQTALSTDAASHPRRTKSLRLLLCYVWRMKQYFNVKSWFTTPRTSKTRPRGRAKFLKSALRVWFTNYEIQTRN